MFDSRRWFGSRSREAEPSSPQQAPVAAAAEISSQREWLDVLPDFLCIGAQKAGTSWLAAQLRKHPEVWLPPVKELHYFDHLYVDEVRPWTQSHLRSGVAAAVRHHFDNNKTTDWEYVRYLDEISTREVFSEAWYRRCFSMATPQSKFRGDVTPEYSTIPPSGIEYMLRLLPAARIIYLIRDPIERAKSAIRMAVQRRNAAPTEEVLMRICEEPDTSHRGDYATYVPRWQGMCRNIMFLPYGSIASEPIELLRRVESFIGLTPFDGYAAQERIHASRKIDMPEAVERRLLEMFGRQRQFVLDHFGEDFAKRTY